MLQSVTIVGLVAAVYVIIIGTWASKQAKKAFKKYESYQDIQQLDSKLIALVRNDFKKWNKQRILIGCYTLFPIRIFVFATMIFGCLIFAFLLKVFGPRTFINFLFTLFLNTYAKFTTRVTCTVKEQFDTTKAILTPIVISNHVNWFDIFYLTMGYAPLSFVTKAEVKKWPFIGILAKARQCVFVDRNCEDARKKTRQDIKTRIDEVNKMVKNKFPLVIFPEGTTSNGNGLLTFKNGAFENMSSITAFCLRYECKDFGLGLDELNQIEHAILMMSQNCRLIVKKVVFEPNIGENSQEYENRCRSKMAEILGVPHTQGGYRDKITLQEMRQKKKKDS